MTIKINIKKTFIILIVSVIFISSLYTLLFRRNDIKADDWDDFNIKIRQEIGSLTEIKKSDIENSSGEEKVLIQFYINNNINDSDRCYLIEQTRQMLYKIRGNSRIYIWFKIYVNKELKKLYKPTSYTYWSVTNH